MVNKCYSVYLLTPRNPDYFLTRTYVGFTTNVTRRIRQHNQEIKGGAKKTSKLFPWELVAYVSGFNSQVEALKFEWMWQHPLQSKKSRTLLHEEVKGKKGAGKIGSVKRKILELFWLLHLEPHIQCTLTVNPTLFSNENILTSQSEFEDKLGLQELQWPEQVCFVVGDNEPNEENSFENELIDLITPLKVKRGQQASSPFTLLE